MYAALCSSESARSVNALLAKHEHYAIKSPSLRELVQPRHVIERFAQFPEQRTDIVIKRPSPSCKRIPDNIRNKIARLRSKGVRFDDIAKRLKMPVGTCKSVMHQRKKEKQ